MQILFHTEINVRSRSTRGTQDRVAQGGLFGVDRHRQLRVDVNLSCSLAEIALQCSISPTTDGQQLCIVEAVGVLFVGNGSRIEIQFRTSLFIQGVDTFVAVTDDGVVVGPEIARTLVCTSVCIVHKPTIALGIHRHITTEEVTKEVNGALSEIVMLTTVGIEQ